MLPESADVIIIGAGVMGCSIAYHLTQLGITDVVLLEKEKLAGMGSTSKANGGIRAQFATEVNIHLSLKSMEILNSLEEEMKEQVDYIKAGYFFMTSDTKNLKILQEMVKVQKKKGVDVQELSKKEIEKRAPWAFTQDVIGGTFGPRDGFVDPGGLSNALLGKALKGGARLFVETEVVGMIKSGERLKGVNTSLGDIKSETVVNAAGPYASRVAQMAGIKIPVNPIRRHIAVTGRVESLPPLIPMTVDFDSGLVIRREGQAVSMACADPREKPTYDISLDRKYFEFIAPKILKRFPILDEAGIDTKKSWAGLYSVTPDHHPILGPVEEIRGLYLANGFSGHGLMHSPAVGLTISELILKGKAESVDISPLSLKRFREGKLLQEKTVL